MVLVVASVPLAVRRFMHVSPANCSVSYGQCMEKQLCVSNKIENVVLSLFYVQAYTSPSNDSPTAFPETISVKNRHEMLFTFEYSIEGRTGDFENYCHTSIGSTFLMSGNIVIKFDIVSTNTGTAFCGIYWRM